MHYFSAIIYREKLDNKFNSLYAAYSLLESKPTLEQEFAAFRHIKFIEKQIIEHNKKNTEENGIEFDKAVEFYQGFTKLENWINEAACFHVKLWTELLEKDPSADRIIALGTQIMSFTKKLGYQYGNLLKLKPDSMSLLQLYENFQKEIINDQNERGETKEKLRNISVSAISRQQLYETQDFNNDEDLQKPIIIMSGDPGSLGTITDISPEAVQILGFKRNELLFKDISTITPDHFGAAHMTFFELYSGSHSINQKELEFLIYPVTKKGYIKPCYAMPYVIPHLNQGLQFVFFIKEMENTEFILKRTSFENRFGVTHFIAFNFVNHKIVGITESCYESFGIPPELVGGLSGEFIVGDIFPEFENIILDNPIIEDFITILDTSTLDQRYFIHSQRSDMSISIEDRQ